MDFLDNTKVNAILDRQLMGELTRKTPVGQIWTVQGEDGIPRIVKTNPVISEKTGFTSVELERMSVVDLMVRKETVKVHVEKYFKQAYKEGRDIVMRSHGQGFQLKHKDGEHSEVELALAFVREDPALKGERMIPQKQRESFLFAVVIVIFKEVFGKILED